MHYFFLGAGWFVVFRVLGLFRFGFGCVVCHKQLFRVGCLFPVIWVSFYSCSSQLYCVMLSAFFVVSKEPPPQLILFL